MEGRIPLGKDIEIVFAEAATKIPAGVRVLGNFLIFFSVLSFVSTVLLSIYASPMHQAGLVVADMAFVVCAFGYRKAKKWSVYTMASLFLLAMAYYIFVVTQGAPADLAGLCVASVLPIVVATITYFHWRSFE